MDRDVRSWTISQNWVYTAILIAILQTLCASIRLSLCFFSLIYLLVYVNFSICILETLCLFNMFTDCLGLLMPNALSHYLINC